MITVGLLLGSVDAAQLAQELSPERERPSDRFRLDSACRDVRHDRDDKDEDDKNGRGEGHIKHHLECRAPSGSGVARGDFNNDGFGDLAVGVPREDILVGSRATLRTVPDAGQVTIIYGTIIGLAAVVQEGVPPPPPSRVFHQNTVGVTDSVEDNDQFGSALASGDFNGDNFSDLAIAVPGERDASGAKRGAIQVLFGRATGLEPDGNQFISGTSFSVGGQPLFLLDSLGWGDFNNDGFGDLVIEAGSTQDGVGTSAPTAAIIVLPGAATGLDVSTAVVFTIANASVMVTGDILIFFVDMKFSAGDIDGNGFDDLVIGKRGAPFGGAIEILKGSASGLTTTGRQFLDQRSTGLSDAAAGDDYGAAVTVGDFNDDVFADVAVGVPGEDLTNPDAGGVEVLMGSALGANPAAAARFARAPAQAQADENFGAALAAGDFNGDGRKDLAIGIPEQNVGTINDAGAIQVIFGSATGLTLTGGFQVFSQTAASGAAEANDRFGSVLTAWNFGRSTHADLAIGVPSEDVGTLVNAGGVTVLYGSMSGLSAGDPQFWTSDSPGVPDSAEAGDGFGSAVY